jgi:hypothetical protein
MTEESKRIISQYINEFNSPPRYAPCDVSTDAILMGNGDMGQSAELLITLDSG